MTVVTLDANNDPSYCRMMDATGDRALIETFMARRPSTEEREAAGKALREKVPRTSHAHDQPSADRPDPVSILEKQSEGRVPLMPISVRIAGGTAALRPRGIRHDGNDHRGRGGVR